MPMLPITYHDLEHLLRHKERGEVPHPPSNDPLISGETSECLSDDELLEFLHNPGEEFPESWNNALVREIQFFRRLIRSSLPIVLP